MPTLSQMISEVRSNLAGYTLRQDRITNLANTGGITATDLSIQIGSADNLAKGIIEIDDELIWINSFDKSNLTLNVIPGFGRGYQGTTPSPHSQNAQVTLTPTFPRVTIKQALNDTINSLLPVNKWRIDRMANVAAFDTTKTVNIYDKIQPGRTVQVYYSTIPNNLTNANDDYATVTGLPESSRDVATLGAAYRLLSYLDTGRINLTSAEADLADSKLPSTAGASASKYVFALFQQRLAEESTKLQDRFPIRVHYTR